MRGPRPAQPHMAAFWDAAMSVGRIEVTDLIEEVIEKKVEASRRFYPDLYAHLITEALIAEGFIEPLRVLSTATPVVIPHLDDIVAAAERSPARQDAEDLLANALDGPAGEDDYSVEPLRRIIAALT